MPKKAPKTRPTPNPSKRSSVQSLLASLQEAKTLKDLQSIASQIGIAPKTKPLPPDQYERKKTREAARQRKKSRDSREISTDCPNCTDPKTRDRIVKNLKFALLTLFPKRFNLEFSQDHCDFIADIERTIRTGGQLASAMPRGTGKTSILVCAVIWAILTGVHPFVVLIGATGEAAKELLEQIRSEFETNEAIYAYFPELVHPVRKLEGINQRRLLWNGQPIKQTWKKARIILPDKPGGPGAGAIIAVAGLDGRIRGMNHLRTDGRSVRPTLVLIDDPQTRKSAASRVQTQKREQIICGDVMGLAGPDRRIAALVACTVIHRNDLSDRLLDRELHPEWQGKRTKLLKSLPTNLEKWEEYAEILRSDLKAGLGRDRATQFYRRNRRKMDEGTLAAWPSRFEPGQVSAVQYCMDLRILNREAFEAEYQNEPQQSDDDDAQKLMTADEIVTRINAVDRGRIPLKAHYLTAFIDVQKDVLYWMVCWWSADFTGGIVDYGTWPDQGKNYFALREANPTLQTATKRRAMLPAIRAGLDQLIETLMSRKFDREGTSMKIDKLGIDANWGESTETVYAAIRESVYVQYIRPTHGKGLTVTANPMAQWPVKEGEYNDGHWIRHNAGRRGLRWTQIDTNYWKTFIHNALNLFPEERHSISLFKAPSHIHRMLADHLTSATRQRPRAEDGRKVDIWIKNPGADNHLFDTLVGNAVMASELGVTLADIDRPQRRRRRQTVKATPIVL